MASTTTKTSKKKVPPRLLVDRKERLSIWRRAKGLWKSRKPDPILEAKRLRDEWPS
jgi:hypothetical protein